MKHLQHQIKMIGLRCRIACLFRGMVCYNSNHICRRYTTMLLTTLNNTPLIPTTQITTIRNYHQSRLHPHLHLNQQSTTTIVVPQTMGGSSSKTKIEGSVIDIHSGALLLIVLLLLLLALGILVRIFCSRKKRKREKRRELQNRIENQIANLGSNLSQRAPNFESFPMMPHPMVTPFPAPFPAPIQKGWQNVYHGDLLPYHAGTSATFCNRISELGPSQVDQPMAQKSFRLMNKKVTPKLETSADQTLSSTSLESNLRETAGSL